MKLILIIISNLILLSLVKIYKIKYNNIFILSNLFLILFINKNNVIFLILSIIFPFLFIGIIKDYFEMWIPYSVSIVITLCGIILSLYNRNFNYGPLIVLIISLFIILLMHIIRKEFIGIGDLKLLFSFSFFITLKNLYYLLFVSSVIALIIELCKKKKEVFPFGPYLGYSFMFFVSFI